MVVLTKEMIERLMTPAGGYNRAALGLLGVSWPPMAGWKAALIGTQISERDYNAALRAKDQNAHFFRGNTRKRR